MFSWNEPFSGYVFLIFLLNFWFALCSNDLPKRYVLRKHKTCGEGGIRTLGTRNAYNGFRDRPVQPLRHLSVCAAKRTKFSP